MGFRTLPDNLGKIFVPEGTGTKKNPCPDCFSCQWCANERCRVCREKPFKSIHKLRYSHLPKDK